MENNDLWLCMWCTQKTCSQLLVRQFHPSVQYDSCTKRNKSDTPQQVPIFSWRPSTVQANIQTNMSYPRDTFHLQTLTHKLGKPTVR